MAEREPDPASSTGKGAGNEAAKDGTDAERVRSDAEAAIAFGRQLGQAMGALLGSASDLMRQVMGEDEPEADLPVEAPDLPDPDWPPDGDGDGDADDADGDADAQDVDAESEFVVEPERPGTVYLVGAGPGDPGLLTVRGREVLEGADVVVYDRLIDPALLDHCPPHCERLDAGKQPGRQAMDQGEINRTLVERASRGLQVVRLKGGDPFVFGRGGEEALALAATGVPYEVIPGVTSAVAVPAYAGIPVTHRDVAGSFGVVTGHQRPGRPTAAVDWSAYGRQPDTLVVLMGMADLEAIAEALVAAGRDPATPAAVIAAGTTARQQTVVSDLRSVAAAVAAEGLRNPATLVVGRVVRLREQLQWLERRTLFGKRIVLTRTREQASGLAARLRLLGAEPVGLPVLRIIEQPDPVDLEWAITNVATFWWVCFTSAHAVGPFFAALYERGLDARTLAGTRVACVGPATAQAVRAHGIVADVVPERATAADLVEALSDQVRDGQKALFVRGEPASPTLAAGLTQLGLEVRQVIAYEAVSDWEAAGRARDLLEGGADAVTFASSASVGHFLEAAGEDGRALCAASKVVCIGPVTAQAAEAYGLRVDAVAAEPTTEAMVVAIAGLWSTDAQEDEDG